MARWSLRWWCFVRIGWKPSIVRVTCRRRGGMTNTRVDGGGFGRWMSGSPLTCINGSVALGAMLAAQNLEG